MKLKKRDQEAGLVGTQSIPDKPNSRHQKYRLTAKGRKLAAALAKMLPSLKERGVPNETPAVQICWRGDCQTMPRGVVRGVAFKGVHLATAWV